MVYLLPHQRYDLYQRAVQILGSMRHTLVDHSLCGEADHGGDVEKNTSDHIAPEDNSQGHGAKAKHAADSCPWKRNHASKASLKENNTILNLAVTDMYGVPAAGLQVITRRTNKDILMNEKEDVENKTDQKLLELTKDISERLTQDVFSKEGRDIIENTRTLLDLPNLAIKIRSQDSSLKVALVEFPVWYEAVKKIPVDELEDIPVEELKSQFKVFVARLDKLTERYTVEDLMEVDARVLIKEFFDEKKQLYSDIEMILQAMAVASVKHSCESILESFVSRYENHFDERRNVDEDTANEEFEICVNGPNLANSEPVIKEAMDDYWNGKSWHFYRTSSLDKLINPSGISNTIKRMISSKNKLPCMD